MSFDQFYDATRVPIGVDFIATLLKPDYHVLDVGCGSGNYIQKLAPIVSQVTGIDNNQVALERARSKLTCNPNVNLVEGSLTERLPFDDNSFDLVMVNQVLQYLDTEDDFPNCHHLLRELHRVLRPSGVLSINTCTQEQMDAFWYSDLVPQAKEKYAKKFISIDKLGTAIVNSGFRNELKGICLPAPLQGTKYFSLLGPLDSIWRMGDSLWELVTPEELEQAQETLMEKLKVGELGAYFDQRDKIRREKGQTMFIVGQKSFPVKVI